MTISQLLYGCFHNNQYLLFCHVSIYVCMYYTSYIINNGKKKDKCFTLFTTYSVYGITYFISILKKFWSNNHA